MNSIIARCKISDVDFLKSVLETITNGVMVVDNKGVIISMNRAAEEITGYKADEVIGKQCTVLDTDACAMHSVKGEKIQCDLFKKGHVKNKQCQIRNKKGKFIHLLKNAIVLKDKKGKVMGAVETITDVTSLFMKEMEIEELRQKLNNEYGFMGLIGRNPLMQEVYEQIKDASRSDVPVNILGESGTGKELVAKAIHKLSGRRKRPFVSINCAALNEHLLESELFGHLRGSFTGATSDRKGRFEAANNGSLLLDEIGDMSLAMQAKLLRVLQEKEIDRIGSDKPVKVDVRVITATNKDIDKLIQDRSFREDLFYRINVFPIHLPPLRDRVDDIPLLASHYLKKISIVNQRSISGLSRSALEVLQSYNWPGNIRQLINVLEYGALGCKESIMDVRHLPEYLTGRNDHMNNVVKLRDDERQNIIEVLNKNNYNRTRTAEDLNISRVALWKKMKRLGIAV